MPSGEDDQPTPRLKPEFAPPSGEREGDHRPAHGAKNPNWKIEEAQAAAAAAAAIQAQLQQQYQQLQLKEMWNMQRQQQLSSEHPDLSQSLDDPHAPHDFHAYQIDEHGSHMGGREGERGAVPPEESHDSKGVMDTLAAAATNAAVRTLNNASPEELHNLQGSYGNSPFAQLPFQSQAAFAAAILAAQNARLLAMKTRQKEYNAPKGVWKCTGGFVATIYAGRKRVYAPARPRISQAAKDRERLQGTLEQAKMSFREAQQNAGPGVLDAHEYIHNYVKAEATAMRTEAPPEVSEEDEIMLANAGNLPGYSAWAQRGEGGDSFHQAQKVLHQSSNPAVAFAALAAAQALSEANDGKGQEQGEGEEGRQDNLKRSLEEHEAMNLEQGERPMPSPGMFPQDYNNLYSPGLPPRKMSNFGGEGGELEELHLDSSKNWLLGSQTPGLGAQPPPRQGLQGFSLGSPGLKPGEDPMEERRGKRLRRDTEG